MLDNDWALTVPVCITVNAGSAAAVSLQELVSWFFYDERRFKDCWFILQGSSVLGGNSSLGCRVLSVSVQWCVCSDNNVLYEQLSCNLFVVMFQKKNSQAISIRIRPASINPLLFSTLMLEGGDVTMFFMEDDIKSIAEDSHHHSKTYTLKSIIVYVKYAF